MLDVPENQAGWPRFLSGMVSNGRRDIRTDSPANLAPILRLLTSIQHFSVDLLGKDGIHVGRRFLLLGSLREISVRR